MGRGPSRTGHAARGDRRYLSEAFMALLQPVPTSRRSLRNQPWSSGYALLKTASCATQGKAIEVFVGPFYCPWPHLTARH
jgi:hypothetical protein